MTGNARAEVFGDCAPIGTLENFEAAAAPQNWVFAAEGFRSVEGKDGVESWVHVWPSNGDGAHVALLQIAPFKSSMKRALKLEIQGHTDNVGSDAYNQPLSEARARAVVGWLGAHDVAAGRLGARGHGKTRQIATNATDEGRAQNRRVEIANPGCKI